jgi:Arc/MetJ family transcription regulator
MGNGLWEGCLPNAPHHNCQPLALERSRRTTIVIDDKLMKETLRLTDLKVKREAVELGLRTLVRLRKQDEIRQFRGKLDALLDNEPVATGDLVLAEILQGFGSVQDFNQGRKLLTSLPIIGLVGRDIAVQAAKSFRILRARGITMRNTIHRLIATSGRAV